MTPIDCEPKTETEQVIEYIEGPDSKMRYMFAIYWKTDYIPGHPKPEPSMTRGQIFFGDPSKYHRDGMRTVDHRKSGLI